MFFIFLFRNVDLREATRALHYVHKLDDQPRALTSDIIGENYGCDYPVIQLKNLKVMTCIEC